MKSKHTGQVSTNHSCQGWAQATLAHRQENVWLGEQEVYPSNTRWVPRRYQYQLTRPYCVDGVHLKLRVGMWYGNQL